MALMVLVERSFARSASGDIVQLKLRLVGINPVIWRRVLVPVSISLHELHGVFQVATGWEGIRLYAFDIYAVQYGSFELMMSCPRVSLSQFGFRKNSTFSYTYDMGGGWEHAVRADGIKACYPKKSYPLCTGGAGTCPPEDCAGPHGFLERRTEAYGYDAWQDMHAMLDLLSEATKPDVGPDVVQSFLNEDVRMTMDRILSGQDYLTTFSRKPISRAFRDGWHRELMHQQWG